MGVKKHEMPEEDDVAQTEPVRGFGLWAEHGSEDGLVYQARLRAEWDREVEPPVVRPTAEGK
jgi:hypothetical protein